MENGGGGVDLISQVDGILYRKGLSVTLFDLFFLKIHTNFVKSSRLTMDTFHKFPIRIVIFVTVFKMVSVTAWEYIVSSSMAKPARVEGWQRVVYVTLDNL